MILINPIYYYPLTDGAPSKVARDIFETLLLKRDQLPFENIVLYTVPKFKHEVGEKFKGITVFSNKDIFKIKNSIVHIPVSPLVFPNSKFLLHLFTKIGNNRLVLNYHGDIRNEVILRFKYDHKLELSNIPTCILLTRLLSSSDRLVVNSYLLADLVKRRHGLKSVDVVPNAVDEYWFSTDHKISPKKRDLVEIFFHGRLSPEKGVDLLIEGLHYAILNDNVLRNKIIIYIAGDGPQKNYLMDLSQRLGIKENVSFLGTLDQKLIKRYLKTVDAAIYPSIWDSFALSILEAFACAECPVYFSKKAGICDFTVNDGYKLNSFEPDVNSLAKIINSIFKRSVDRKIIDLQKRFAEKYTWNNIIYDYIDIYKELATKQ